MPSNHSCLAHRRGSRRRSRTSSQHRRSQRGFRRSSSRRCGTRRQYRGGTTKQIRVVVDDVNMRPRDSEFTLDGNVATLEDLTFHGTLYGTLDKGKSSSVVFADHPKIRRQNGEPLRYAFVLRPNGDGLFNCTVELTFIKELTFNKGTISMQVKQIGTLEKGPLSSTDFEDYFLGSLLFADEGRKRDLTTFFQRYLDPKKILLKKRKDGNVASSTVASIPEDRNVVSSAVASIPEDQKGSKKNEYPLFLSF